MIYFSILRVCVTRLSIALFRREDQFLTAVERAEAELELELEPEGVEGGEGQEQDQVQDRQQDQGCSRS